MAGAAGERPEKDEDLLADIVVEDVVEVEFDLDDEDVENPAEDVEDHRGPADSSITETLDEVDLDGVAVTPIVLEGASRGDEVARSTVRTVALPAVVTAIVAFVLHVTGFDLGPFEAFVSVAVGWTAYAVVRALEVFASPKWGYVLGLPGSPVYVKPE